MNACSHSRLRQALQRRLDRAALEQLRAVAAELHTRVETLQTRLDHAERRIEDAERAAECWRDDAMNLQHALDDSAFATHRAVGINQAGEMVVVRVDNAPTPERH